MRQNKVLFFAIIGLAILVVGAMVLAVFFIPTIGPQPTSVQIVVAPSAKAWVDQAAQDFNSRSDAARVEIVTASELVPVDRFRGDNPDGTPVAAWLAEAEFVVDLGREQGIETADVRSVASTNLAWGAYRDKLDQFEESYGPLSWQSLNAKATNPADTLKVVIAAPQNSAEGLAALASATAAHLDTTSISGSEVSQANDWLIDTLGERKAQMPPTPAQSLASVQGRTLGDVGLLTTASWRTAGLDQQADFTLLPVEPNVALDYPFVIWAGATSEAQEAAAAFRDFLLSDPQQNALAASGLEPAGLATGRVQVDGVGTQRLLDWVTRALR